ncbi:hypothetical protein LPJ75_006371, partial [Coemansia sp. RSA 2598]
QCGGRRYPLSVCYAGGAQHTYGCGRGICRAVRSLRKLGSDCSRRHCQCRQIRVVL